MVTTMSGVSAYGAENPPVANAQKRLTEWRQVKAQVQNLESQNLELAHRIAALKRVRRTDVANRKLENLLQQSVGAAAELERLVQQQSSRAQLCRESIRSGIKAIDKKISTQKAGLKSSSSTKRRQTAKRLRRLLQSRKQLRNMQSQLRATQGMPKSWKQYEVRIDPLDGPEELREKVDFIEDTRDKLLKKRKRISILIKERKQVLALAKAANQFATDVSAFDESARSGRVERQGTRGQSFTGAFVANDEAANVSAAPPPRASASGSSQESPDQTVSPGATGGSDNSSQAPENDSLDTQSAKRTSNPVGTSIAAPEQSAASWVKQLNPDMLINLNISELSGDKINFAQLDQLMGNLAKLDAYLKGQSNTILRRADKIEEDEKQVLQK